MKAEIGKINIHEMQKRNGRRLTTGILNFSFLLLSIKLGSRTIDSILSALIQKYDFKVRDSLPKSQRKFKLINLPTHLK
jgi:hypothetical protein